MSKKKKSEGPESNYVTIKVNRGIKERVEKEKGNKFMPLGVFYDEAVLHKLEREKIKNQDKV